MLNRYVKKTRKEHFYNHIQLAEDPEYRSILLTLDEHEAQEEHFRHSCFFTSSSIVFYEVTCPKCKKNSYGRTYVAALDHIDPVRSTCICKYCGHVFTGLMEGLRLRRLIEEIILTMFCIFFNVAIFMLAASRVWEVLTIVYGWHWALALPVCAIAAWLTLKLIHILISLLITGGNTPKVN